jgi:hypothetical protein
MRSTISHKRLRGAVERFLGSEFMNLLLHSPGRWKNGGLQVLWKKKVCSA